MWQWITCNSSAIQAAGAGIIVLVSALTLIVLCIYAADTKRIAKASVQQVENAQTPFLAVRQEENVPNQVGGWILENQGFGPALNIVCRYCENQQEVRVYMYSLGPRTPRSLQNHFANARGTPEGFTIEYASLSGKNYETFITWVGQEMKTEFRKH
jgi:hypothetical protein